MNDVFSNIIIGVISGIISGLYTGLVMSKYVAFAQHRLTIIDIVSRIEFGGTNGILDYAKFSKIEEISYSSCSLLYLGHTKAGKKGLLIYKDIMNTEQKFKNKILTLSELIDKNKKWQDAYLDIKPNIISILSLNIKL